MALSGIGLLTDISGYSADNIQKLAEEGMSFTRMYTEPSCTPTRVAAATGRLAVRSGMIFPIFPIHRMGLPASEVTIAEVVGDTYHTGFFEKAHFGDQEEGYVTNQGWDEAIFSLYNQFAGQMFTSDARTKASRLPIRPTATTKSISWTTPSGRWTGCGP